MDGSIALDNFKYSFNLNSPNFRIIFLIKNPERGGEGEGERHTQRHRDTDSGVRRI